MAREITFENVRIGFRNFSGAEGQYNREGDRNFLMFIDDQSLAQQMESDGWNVKYLKPRDDQEEPQAYIQVAVNYKGRPPKIYMVTSRGKTLMDQKSVGVLDWVEIETVDVILNPYNWSVNGNSGIKAYANSLFVVIREDELDRKYIDVPDSASNVLQSKAEVDEPAF